MMTTLTKRQLRWYQTTEGTALQERITVEGNDGQIFVEQDWLDVPLEIECLHEWVDATNEHVEGMDLCSKCGAIRSQPDPIRLQYKCMRCDTVVVPTEKGNRCPECGMTWVDNSKKR